MASFPEVVLRVRFRWQQSGISVNQSIYLATNQHGMTHHYTQTKRKLKCFRGIKALEVR